MTWEDLSGVEHSEVKAVKTRSDGFGVCRLSLPVGGGNNERIAVTRGESACMSGTAWPHFPDLPMCSVFSFIPQARLWPGNEARWWPGNEAIVAK